MAKSIGPMKLVGIVGFALLLVGCGNDESVTAPAPTPAPTPPPGQTRLDLSYVGSEACGVCHGEILNEFLKSGHPYKLNKVENGQPPQYPFTDVPSPPAGFTWTDVAYVIGGFGWKARFIGLDGFIITQGGSNQYNLATGGWVDYHPDEQKPYNCGGCHTTGYRPDGHQDDLPGIIGQWEFPGIQCEECHGPGSFHAESPLRTAMTIDTRAEACGRCHNRGGMNAQVPASKGFIRHHEQFNELQQSGHMNLECVTCHDPHTGVRFNDQEGAVAIRVGCDDCHTKARQSLLDAPLGPKMGTLECESCHMPQASKSAVASGPFTGDVRTHIFKIDPDSLANMFTPDGAFATGALTTEFACLECHADKDKAWAAVNAPDVHGPTFAAVRLPAPIRF